MFGTFFYFKGYKMNGEGKVEKIDEKVEEKMDELPENGK